MLKRCCIFTIIITGLFFTGRNVYAADAETYSVKIAKTDMTYEKYSEEMTYEKAFDIFSSLDNQDAVVISSAGKVYAMKYGIAVLAPSGSTITFTSKYPGGIPTYATKNCVAYYNSTNKQKVVTLTISAYTATAPASSLFLIPDAFCYHRNSKSTYSLDYYTKNSSGSLVHYISTYSSTDKKTTFASIAVDKAPSFMQESVRYYSTDGYNYYKTPRDAVTGKNLLGKHLIYFKHLSYRTTTSYTAADLNKYIAYKNTDYDPKVKSAYLNKGEAFMNAQKIYGVNAAMELAFANHESAYGKSSIAVGKLNFFGVNAVDSNPSNASTYSSAEECIMQHAKYYMNRYYLDAHAYIDSSKGSSYYDVPDKPKGHITEYNGDSRYFGSVPGNKLVGINVRYASSPFHGEGVAGHMYSMDKYLGSKDYGRYTIGITKTVTKAYSEPNTSSWVLYKYTSKDPSRSKGDVSSVPIGMNVVIIGDYGDFYKVLSEMPVNNDKRACFVWDYDSSLSYAFVKKSDIEIAFIGSDKLETPKTDPVPEPEPEPGPGTDPPVIVTELKSSIYTISTSKGLITRIPAGTSASDFVKGFSGGSVKVMKDGKEVTEGILQNSMTIAIYSSDGTYLTDYCCIITGDINNDGKITITDLVQINNHLLGTSVIKGFSLNAADINGDGKVNITDLVQINNHILGSSEIKPI